MNDENKSGEELLLEVEKLRAQLAEAEETLAAIRSGEVDALVVSGKKGDQVFTLKGAEQPYRILIEEMNEGAAMLADDDSILYCNSGLAGMLKTPLEKLMGTGIAHYIAPSDEALFRELLQKGRHKSSKGEITLLAGDGTFISTHLSFNSLAMDDARFVYLVATDLTERKQMEEALRRARDELEIRVAQRTEELDQANKTLKLAQRSASAGVWDWNLVTGEVKWSEEYYMIYGIKPADYKPSYENWLRTVHPDDRDLVDKATVHAAIGKKRDVDIEFRTIFPDASIRWLNAKGKIFFDKDSRPIRMIGITLDITERKQAEEALKQSEERFRSIFSQSPIGIGVYDAKGELVELNDAAMAIYGISRLDRIQGMRLFSNHTIPEKKIVMLRNGERVREEVAYDFDTIRRLGYYETSKSGISHFDRTITPLHSSQGCYGYLVQVQDISARKQIEEALRKAHEELELRVRDRTTQLMESLEEKEILLREIHHRVKNNMQVISGLLMLQEEFSNDDKVSGMIKESQNRIASMALIHEKLYRSESLSKIDFKEYADDLVSGLFESYGITDSKASFRVNAENIHMGIDAAIPCGLIINELVSNSLKHAFPPGKNGEIEISLTCPGDNMIELSVRDNGVGIPEGIDFRNTESLGLHIVNILVENQLHGRITMNNNNGTEFRIRFRGIIEPGN